MKKIGLISCGLEPNYGACLQAFATQHVISKMGYDIDIIKYSFMDEREYSPFTQRKIKSFVTCCLFYSLRKGIHFAFDEFRKKHMRYSDKSIKDRDSFKEIIEEYDCFLVGSDQVWNPYLGIDTDITLLNFYDNGPKKVSYASSFGISELPEDKKSYYKEALEKFDFISVREQTGKKIVEELINKKVDVVLDPTLLLKAEDWAEFAEPYNIKGSYVLIYDMYHTSEVRQIAEKVAKIKNARIVALSRIIIPDINIKTLNNVSPGNCLWLIKNAQAVVTDSFHGTALSANFNKEFYTYCPAKGKKISGRITGFLDNIGLKKRIINDPDAFSASAIDFSDANKKLDELRSNSFDYLRSALEFDKSK